MAEVRRLAQQGLLESDERGIRPTRASLAVTDALLARIVRPRTRSPGVAADRLDAPA